MTQLMQMAGRKSLVLSSAKAAVAVLLFLVITQISVRAQWTTNGNNINNTNSGNVGIGTSSPNALLEINKSQNAGTTQILDNGYTTSGNAAFSGLFLKQAGANRFFLGSVNDNNTTQTGGAGTVQFWNFANGPTLFATNNSERLRIDSAGNVGIGTAAPGDKLVTLGNSLVGNITTHTQLYSGYDSQSNVTFELGYGTATSNITPLSNLVISKNLTSANNALGNIFFANSSIANGNEKRLAGMGTWTDGATNSGLLAFYTSASGTLAERVRITSGGNVGIGITTPLYSLDVNGGTNGFRAKAATTSSNDAIATFENAAGIQAIVRASGNVGIGVTSPTEKLEVAGNLKLTGTGNITASGNLTVTGTINAKYQDVAEWVESSQQLSAGTVVVLDHTKSNQVVASSHAYDTRVAGVISVQPGITLGEKSETKVLVATTGRVKVKVDASSTPIHVGDLLVTSDIAGLARTSEPLLLGGVQIHRPGTLIGKALEPLEKGTGEILVLLSLQ